MLPGAQLLTIPTASSNYKLDDISSTSKLVLSSNRLILHLQGGSTHNEDEEYMAQHNHRSSRLQTENELWLNMPASSAQQQEHVHRLEPSAYKATSQRISVSSTSGSNLNKPLPPSPSGSEKRSRKPTSLRGFLRREPSEQPESTHLRPEPYHPKRHSASLNVDTNSQHRHTYSRSMPNSPYGFTQSSYQDPATFPRAHSSASNHSDAVQYQPYSLPPQQQSSRPQQQRAVSMNPYFETASTPRSRTFPESTLGVTARDNGSGRPRPHTTWGSPTEAFTDVSQFHLFAEAMTGLPNDTEAFSPTGPPQLRGSLFARRNTNDTIPIPLQHPQSSSRSQPTRRPAREQRYDWQNFEPPPLISSRAAPALNHSMSVPNPPFDAYQQWQPPSRMDAVTAELNLLGLNDPQGSDDELPDYQQSQAEMAAKKRQEASARARELEARWRGTRR
ncbi:hypothetical protein BKA58DRAFT_192306 [Alternaria rosae]|uniref:uncharacterized protein n=1 Tax=Alternaria rosae TaxID=1187941 RepID=UPI001E8EB78F|nr:uncharacterized protein BKA58DRAFT_192306 [Alternaria rosae]KAH6868317.1 hypothetical protein BKA58DRAFT_192306 [Alternaria rosae]